MMHGDDLRTRKNGGGELRRRGELIGEGERGERHSMPAHFISRAEADTAMGGGQVGDVA
jgi:hypothetical protein